MHYSRVTRWRAAIRHWPVRSWSSKRRRSWWSARSATRKRRWRPCNGFAVPSAARRRQRCGEGGRSRSRRWRFDRGKARLVLLRRKHQEVIHLIVFHEIVLAEEAIAGLVGFVDDHVAGDSVIFAIAAAINDSYLGAGIQRRAQVSQQGYRFSNFVVSLQE